MKNSKKIFLRIDFSLNSSKEDFHFIHYQEYYNGFKDRGRRNKGYQFSWKEIFIQKKILFPWEPFQFHLFGGKDKDFIPLFLDFHFLLKNTYHPGNQKKYTKNHKGKYYYWSYEKRNLFLPERNSRNSRKRNNKNGKYWNKGKIEKQKGIFGLSIGYFPFFFLEWFSQHFWYSSKLFSESRRRKRGSRGMRGLRDESFGPSFFICKKYLQSFICFPFFWFIFIFCFFFSKPFHSQWEGNFWNSSEKIFARR